LIGFVTDQQAICLECTGEAITCDLFPEPTGEARTAISLPIARFAEAKGPRRDCSNSLQVDVRPRNVEQNSANTVTAL
jgi:hypothetical protein